MIIIACITFVFLGLRFMVVVVNYFSKPFVMEKYPAEYPLVSILVPMRDEEKNIPVLLNHLIRQTYPNLEIWICDDRSTDRTHEVIRKYQKEHAHIHCFTPEEVPSGWLGKTHACHLLAQKASGDYFLFMDADVSVEKDLVKYLVFHSREEKTDLLSIFPTQMMQTTGEWITVPLVDWFLLTLLPLPLVLKSKNPSFSAANGQIMFFSKDHYMQNQWHSQVRKTLTEDIAIARLMKKKGHRVRTLMGNKQVFCRMYSSFQEATSGLSRSVISFFGDVPLLMLLFIVFTGIGPFIIFFTLPPVYTPGYFILLVFMKTGVSALVRQPVKKNLLLMPLQYISFLYIAFKAMVKRTRNEFTWKGRKLDIK